MTSDAASPTALALLAVTIAHLPIDARLIVLALVG